MALGLPYMGSKRKISKKVVNKILTLYPETEFVYDLFGGGGAVSFEFLQRNGIKQVFYNEIDKGVVSLLRKILKEGVSKDFYNWIDRNSFYENYKNDDWFGGFIKTVWSFGGSQDCYIYMANEEREIKSYCMKL